MNRRQRRPAEQLPQYSNTTDKETRVRPLGRFVRRPRWKLNNSKARTKFYFVATVVAGFCFLVVIQVSSLLWVLSFQEGWFESFRNINFLPYTDFFDKPHLPVVVVGGSDGSGTRAVVDTLKSLGVPVVADDSGTFDIHAAEMFAKQGWPAFVNHVLHETHSANYEWDDLSPNTKTILEREVEKLLQSISYKYNVMKRAFGSDRYRKGVTPLTNALAAEPFFANGLPAAGIEANKASFAIKAPVSMLVLPVLARFMGNIKFIHVLRDGRDIALSSNQSPVLKFYNTTYLDYGRRSLKYSGELYPVRGMNLWNDWNLQVRQWGLAHTASPDTESTNGGFEYFALRSEDLLDPNSRSISLQALANFVGSSIDKEALCCLAQSQPKDYGVSTVHAERNNNFASSEAEHLKEQMSDGMRHGGRPLPKWWPVGIQGKVGVEDEPPVPDGIPGHRDPLVSAKEERALQREMLRREKELRARDESLKHQEGQLKDMRDGLTEREQMLAAREASLHQLEANFKELEQLKRVSAKDSNSGSDPSVQKKESKSDSNTASSSQERRLLEDQGSDDQRPVGAKVMPTQFVKRYHLWRESVELHAKEMQLDTLRKLFEYGRDLEKEWAKHAQVLIGVVDIHEIQGVSGEVKELIRRRMVEQLTVDQWNERGEDGTHPEIHQRYGKWKAQLENRTTLSQWLHAEGKVGLETFGYEPRTAWEYPLPDNLFVCKENASCKKPKKRLDKK